MRIVLLNLYNIMHTFRRDILHLNVARRSKPAQCSYDVLL
jgi:hypothetical protein